MNLQEKKQEYKGKPWTKDVVLDKLKVSPLIILEQHFSAKNQTNLAQIYLKVF